MENVQAAQSPQHPAVFSFQFQNSVEHEVRTVSKEDGSIWFVAKDVCDVLQIKTEQIRRLEDDEKNTLRLTQGIRGNPTVSIISESGLYTLVLRSNKPEAKPFRKWVTSEVLPTIRQTGGYSLSAPTSAITAQPTVAPAEVVAFLQVATDAFWHTNKAIGQHRVIEGELQRTKKAIAAIVDSIKTVFPESRAVLDDVVGNSLAKTRDALPLAVELHRTKH